MKSRKEFERMKKLAFDAAIEAGKIVESYFYRETAAKSKEKMRGDFVTEADLASEKYIIRRIRKEFPKANILSEEAGMSSLSKNNKDNAYLWLVDPIDGTTHFKHGLPDFCVILGIAKGSKPIFAVAYFPLTKQMFWAEKGKGAFLDKKRIKVSSMSKLKDSVFSFGVFRSNKYTPSIMKMYNHAFFHLKKVLKTGSIGLTAAMISSGRFEANISNFYSSHDSALMAFLIEEAGGKATDINGNELDINTSEGTVNIFSNGKIHKQAIAYTKKFVKQDKTKHKLKNSKPNSNSKPKR